MKQYMIYLNTEESVLVDAKEWVIRGKNISSFRLEFLGEEEGEGEHIVAIFNWSNIQGLVEL